MSWGLAEKLKARFPEVEIFPRPEEPSHAQPEEQKPREAAPGAPAAARRPAHEAPPSYLVPGAVVPLDKLLEIARVVATDAEFELAYLSFVTAVDRLEAGEFEIVYHCYSHPSLQELMLKVRVPRDKPTVPSVTAIWDGANWHEREAYDLFGIIFEGHPNLRRIMMTDDWIGHPLRKDYVYQDPAWLVEVAKRRKEEIEGLGLGERA